ncbi:MAG: hypothetical protein Q9M40_13650 [Sulfurimonas sp.]|nr:hypothetical protein [Sulfurimonas sp.]
MTRILLFLFFITNLFSSEVERHRWPNGETFLVFLEKNSLPIRPLYYNLDKDDQRLTEEMRSGMHYQVLLDANKTIEQILLPLNDELQIHIYKNADTYKFEAIPIISTTKVESFATKIVSSPNYTIMKETGSKNSHKFLQQTLETL